jgi:elongation factor Ts
VEITTAMVKELREASGAGVMDAKRALEEAKGDMKQAVAILRERGAAAAAKRSDRETKQGVVESYIHAGGRIGVLVEVNCETDFVANTEDFRNLSKSIALQIAAMNPKYISADEMTGAEDEGTAEEVALLSQPFIRESNRSIGDLIKDAVAKTGENIRVARFVRYELGR